MNNKEKNNITKNFPIFFLVAVTRLTIVHLLILLQKYENIIDIARLSNSDFCFKKYAF